MSNSNSFIDVHSEDSSLRMSEVRFHENMEDVLTPMEYLQNNSEVSEKYNPYQIPADLDNAKLHWYADAIGYEPEDHAHEPCGCCARNRKTELKFCCDNNDEKISKYGMGYVMYFIMQIIATGIMIFPGSMSAVYYSVRNYKGKECMSNKEMKFSFDLLRDQFVTQWNWDGRFMYPPKKGTKMGKDSLYEPPTTSRRKHRKLIRQKLENKQQSNQQKTYQNLNQPIAVDLNVSAKVADVFSFMNEMKKNNFDINKAIKKVNLSSMYLFMHTFCLTRFFFNDQMCVNYAKAGCKDMMQPYVENYAYKMFFSESGTNFLGINEADLVQKHGQLKVTTCKRLAFTKLTLQYTYRSCIMANGAFMSEFGLGNDFEELGKDFWNYFFDSITFVVFLLMIFAASVYMSWKERVLDFSTNIPKDYTVELVGLPREENIPGYNLKDSIKNLFLNKGLDVLNISMVYDTDEFEEKQNELREKRTELAKKVYKLKNGLLTKKSVTCCCSKDTTDYEKETEGLQYDITRLKTETDLIEGTFNNEIVESFQGVAFVFFNTQVERNEAVERFGPGFINFDICPCQNSQKEKLKLKLGDKNYKLLVKDCVNSPDIVFENEKYSGCGRVWRVILAYSILLIIFIGVFACIFCATIMGQNIKDRQIYYDITYNFLSWKWIMSKIYGLIISITVVIFNKIIEISAILQIKFTKHRDRTEQSKSILKTQFIMQFCTTGIVPLASGFLCINQMGPLGLVGEMNSIFIANLITTNLLEIVDVFWILKWIVMKFYEYGYNKDDKSTLAYYCQYELNDLYTRDDFGMEIRYNYYFRNFALALFYLPILPFGIFMTIQATVVFYFTTKWVLYYRSSNSFFVSYMMKRSMFSLLSFCQVLYSTGLCVRQFQIFYYASTPITIDVANKIMITVSLVNWFIFQFDIHHYLFECAKKTCLKSCYKKLKKENGLKKKPTYMECVETWDCTYRSRNPAFKRETTKRLTAFKSGVDKRKPNKKDQRIFYDSPVYPSMR